jgi:hypothetical protein
MLRRWTAKARSALEIEKPGEVLFFLFSWVSWCFELLSPSSEKCQRIVFSFDRLAPITRDFEEVFCYAEFPCL